MSELKVRKRVRGQFLRGVEIKSRGVRHGGGGFTLIELLITLSILALLMALLIPAMSRARESARLAVCMSNLRQILVATHAYSDEYDGDLPFPNPRTIDFLNNSGFGGRFTTSKAPVMSQVYLPQNRPLNRFLYPGRFYAGARFSRMELRSPTGLNLPLFECPSDRSFNYTERSREARTTPEYTQSAYLTAGTSYAFNATWIGNEKFFRYSDLAEPYLWAYGIQMFKRSRYAYPSRFVTYVDEPGNFQSIFRLTPTIAHHGAKGRYSTAFMDGHAALVEILRDQPFSVKHTLLFPEQERRGGGN